MLIELPHPILVKVGVLEAVKRDAESAQFLQVFVWWLYNHIKRYVVRYKFAQFRINPTY